MSPVASMPPRQRLRVEHTDGKVYEYVLVHEGNQAPTTDKAASEQLLLAITLLNQLAERLTQMTSGVDQAVQRLNVSLGAVARFEQSANKLAEALHMDVVAVKDDQGRIIGARRVPKLETL